MSAAALSGLFCTAMMVCNLAGAMTSRSRGGSTVYLIGAAVCGACVIVNVALLGGAA